MSWDRGADDFSSTGRSGVVAPPMSSLSGLNISPYALDPTYLPESPEFIFPVERKKKSWNEKMFDRTGTSYLAGMALGGVWGLAEGLKHSEARTYRLRMNSILNGCTRRGPFLGNNLAVLALMYSSTESLVGHLRGQEDTLNSVAAAAVAGVLYKSTAGVRPMLVAGAVGCGLKRLLMSACLVLCRLASNSSPLVTICLFL
ncbi:hypothetical protein EMCRGX_G008608 [Ephydatia muelleri]